MNALTDAWENRRKGGEGDDDADNKKLREGLSSELYSLFQLDGFNSDSRSHPN